jgi:hypothetical protein
MTRTQPASRVSAYKFPRRTYVVWWLEFLTFFVIAIGATIVRALRETERPSAFVPHGPL